MKDMEQLLIQNGNGETLMYPIRDVKTKSFIKDLGVLQLFLQSRSNTMNVKIT